LNQQAGQTIYRWKLIEVDTMVMELILIRHGETDFNRDSVFRGQMDVRLNATGIAMADATAEALKDKVFEAIYSSPLKRAFVTAKRIAGPHEIEVRSNFDFIDISYGVWQGLPETEVKTKWPGLYEKWLSKPTWVRFPGGESTRHCWKRVISGLREILFQHGTGTIVIVSHRVPIKFMTAYLLGKKRGYINEIKHDPCAMSIFRVDDRKYAPVVLNDSSHLSGFSRAEKKDF
jgi:broad specificity phosphatase PhoE